MYDTFQDSNITMTKKEDLHKLWRRFTYHKNITNFITIVSLLYWSVLVFYLYNVLVEQNTEVTFSYKNRLGFSMYFLIITLYPFIYLFNQLYQTNMTSTSSNNNPYYALCVNGPDNLTPKEFSLGAVGKLDYKCLKETSDYNTQYGEMITSRTWYIIHSIFALVLFLFAQSAGKYKNIDIDISKIVLNIN